MARKRGPKKETLAGDEQPCAQSAAAAATQSAPAAAAATRSRQQDPQSAGASADAAVDEVAKLLSNITLSGRFNTHLAAKPKAGTAGKTVTLVTNLFEIRVNENVAYHYDITFKMEKKAAAASGKKKKGPVADSPAGDAATASESKGDAVVYSDDIKIGRIVRKLFEQIKVHDKDFQSLTAFFDGKQNMFTLRKKLPHEEKIQVFSADVEGEKRNVLCKYTFTGHSLDLSQGRLMSRDAMQALEVGLGYEAGKGLMQRGSRFFDRNSAPIVCGMNLDLRLGFVKSLKLTESGLFINLDRAAALFQKAGKLEDVFVNILNFNNRSGINKQLFRMTDAVKRTLEQELTNLRLEVVVKGLPYKRRVRLEKDGITNKTVREITFEWKETNAKTGAIERQEQISVYDYYFKKYNIRLAYPNLPCIATGAAGKKNFIPVELCNLLPEQYYEKKMHEKIQAQVTQHTIQLPRDRFAGINASMKQLSGFVSHTMDCNISLSAKEVTGRIIGPPKISFLNDQVISVSQMKDRFMNPCDFKWGKFNSSVKLCKWVVIQVQDKATGNRIMTSVHPKIIEFARRLATVATQNAWPINPSFGSQCHNYQDYNGLKVMMQSLAAAGNELMLFLMPSDIIYADIKKVANEIGVVSQCVKLNVDDNFMMNERGKINKMTGNTFINNMLMKMNAKFGGENARLAPVSVPDFLKKKVMIIGMDVFHPGPGSDMKHSLAGFVASYTRCYTKYLQAAKAQKHPADQEFRRKEEIGDEILYGVMIDFLMKFKAINKSFPDYLLVFRDGVSEGQFDKVRLIELDQIYRALQKLGHQAKVTFVTVQKRHHFRMFQKDARTGGVENPEPGTVVDTGIVHPQRFECYLNSHYALKGTSKPSHYCVVHNECGLTADAMQSIAYYLCYLCVRCYKPISIPIPVKYAHLVSEQASKALSSALRNGLKGSVNEWIRIHDKFSDRITYA